MKKKLVFSLFILSVHIISDDNLKKLKLPEGFKISVYANNLDTPRQITQSKNGTVFVGSKNGDSITALIDADNDGVDDKAHIMEEYSEAPEELLVALRNQTHETSEPYTDDWGHFVSSYIPFHDSQGEFVGVLGIDISAEMYQQRTQPIFRATVRTMVAAFFISFMVGSLVWFTRNFSKIVNAKRNHLVDVAAQMVQESKSGKISR